MVSRGVLRTCAAETCSAARLRRTQVTSPHQATCGVTPVVFLTLAFTFKCNVKDMAKTMLTSEAGWQWVWIRKQTD